MKSFLLLISVIAVNFSCTAQNNEQKSITKNKMNVSWHYENDRIYFEMIAPTDGWVTIGFNDKNGMSGAYLLMGNIIDNKVKLVEHYTHSPGNYSPITDLGATSNVEDIEGIEHSKSTQIKFSLPTHAVNKYQKDLTEGQSYNMIIAYSQEDDFQHHSIMRTSIPIIL